MLSVIDISKRRTRFKQTPPGFKISTQNNINNNYNRWTNQTPLNGHVSGSSSEVNHDPPIASKGRNRKVDFISILQNLKSNGECSMHRTPSSTCGPHIHIKPVIEVARRRAKYHQAPPGFKQLPVLDINNNARNSDRNGLVQKNSVEDFASLKPRGLRGEDEDEANNGEQNKVVSSITRQTMALKVKMLLKDLGIAKQVKKEKQKGPIFKTAIQPPDVVGEQEVVVNVMTFDSKEEELTQDLDVRETTPANFLDTIDHYKMVSERRKDMTRLVYMLGDMLIAGEVVGDKEEWINHTEQLFKEEKAWKKKCWDDDVYFEKFNRTSAVKPSSKTRMKEYTKEQLAKIKMFMSDVCPCLF